MHVRITCLILTALLLGGCADRKNTETEVTRPTTLPTVENVIDPLETELPAQIQRPEETLPITLPDGSGDTVVIRSVVPDYDPSLDLDYEIPGENLADGALSSRFYHTDDRANLIYADGLLRICVDPPEMRQGSRYGIFRMEPSGLRQLPGKDFSQICQVLGNEIPVSFSYVSHQDMLEITHVAAGDLPFRIHDADLGGKRCLISFYCSLKDVTTVDYPMILDVTTGGLTDFLESVDRSTLPSDLLLDGSGYYLQYTAMMPRNRLVAKLTGGKYYYFDPVSGKAYDLDNLSGRQVAECAVTDQEIICYDGVKTIWKIHPDTLTSEDILTDIPYVELFSGIWQGRGCSFVLYRDENWNLHAFDFLSMTDQLLREPEGWILEGYLCHPSPDGRKLYFARNGDQAQQLLVFDCDQGNFLQIRRENPNGVSESLTGWTKDSAIVITTEDCRDHYVYDWKGLDESVTQLKERELPVRENGDFVSVQEYIPDVLVDLKYAGPDNFTGQTIYDFRDVYLRYGTVMKLAAVQQELKAQGLGLKIWDGFRPVSAQFKLWEICPDDTYVANPNVGFSNHSRGFAVDLTLVDDQGRELHMPTEFDDFSGKADRNYEDCPQDAAANAMLLQQTMEKHGFAGYYGEWWHFNDTDRYEVEKCFDPGMISQWYADCQEYITLRAQPDTGAEALTRIPAGAEFTCLGKTGDFLLAEYQGLRGYVLSSYSKPI